MPSRRQRRGEITGTQPPLELDADLVRQMSLRDVHHGRYSSAGDVLAPPRTPQESSQRKRHGKSRKTRTPEASHRLESVQDRRHTARPLQVALAQPALNSEAPGTTFKEKARRSRWVLQHEHEARLAQPQPRQGLAFLPSTRGHEDYYDITAPSNFPSQHQIPMMSVSAIPMVAREGSTFQRAEPRNARNHRRGHVNMTGARSEDPGVLVDQIQSNRATWASSTAAARYLYTPNHDSRTAPRARDRTLRRTTVPHGRASEDPPAHYLPGEASHPAKEHPSTSMAITSPEAATRFDGSGPHALPSALPDVSQPRPVERTRPWWRALGHKIQSLHPRFSGSFKHEDAPRVLHSRAAPRSKLRRKPRVRKPPNQVNDVPIGELDPLDPTIVGANVSRAMPASALQAPARQRRMSWFKTMGSGSRFVEAL